MISGVCQHFMFNHNFKKIIGAPQLVPVVSFLPTAVFIFKINFLSSQWSHSIIICLPLPCNPGPGKVVITLDKIICYILLPLILHSPEGWHKQQWRLIECRRVKFFDIQKIIWKLYLPFMHRKHPWFLFYCRTVEHSLITFYESLF